MDGRSPGVSDHCPRNPALPFPLIPRSPPSLDTSRAFHRRGADDRPLPGNRTLCLRRRRGPRSRAMGRLSSGRLLCLRRDRAGHQRHRTRRRYLPLSPQSRRQRASPDQDGSLYGGAGRAGVCAAGWCRDRRGDQRRRRSCLSVARAGVPPGARAAPCFRPRLRGRRRARARPARRHSAQSAVRTGQAHADRARSHPRLRPRALAVARPGADDPPGRDRQLRRLPAAHRRIGGSVPISRAGAAVARSAIFSRRGTTRARFCCRWLAAFDSRRIQRTLRRRWSSR